MRLSEFDYKLPQNLIAQIPATPRDTARLMILKRSNGSITHGRFLNLSDFLKKGDLLIFNNSKVIPARLIGKKTTGGKIEILLLKNIKDGTWEVLLNRKVKPSARLTITKNFYATVLALPSKNIKWKIKFNLSGNKFKKYIRRYGSMPLPPYIKSSKQKNLLAKKQYQTIYANPQKEGSVAAPTAGLHFTKRLFKKLKKLGVKVEYITLHVGLGTFEPVRTKNISQHQMHPEYVEIDKKVLKKIIKAHKAGRRIISVGTTTARALESLPQKINARTNYHKWVNIFIYPGYKFKHIDGMITNFHLPKSTLLMMVSAFSGQNKIKKAYQEALEKKYRFYSYGDAMLIL